MLILHWFCKLFCGLEPMSGLGLEGLRVTWDHLGPILGHLETMLELLGPILGHLEAMLELSSES